MRYRNNHSIPVRTSKGLIEPFNRQKIISSLIHEARLEKTLAEEVALEVEIEIRHMDLEFISAPLIREIVNRSELLRKRLNRHM